MGVQAEPAVLQARESQGEANQLRTVNCTNKDAAGCFHGDRQSKWSHIRVSKAPDFFFQLEHELEFRNRFQITNNYTVLSNRG